MEQFFSVWTIGLGDTVALAAVALIGYLCGQRTQSPKRQAIETPARGLNHATQVAVQLERIAGSIRKDWRWGWHI